MSDSFTAPWTIALQAPLSMGFPKQKYWSGLPLPSPGDLPDPGINLHLLQWQEDSLALSHHIQDQNCVKGLRIHCQNSIFFKKKSVHKPTVLYSYQQMISSLKMDIQVESCLGNVCKI